MIFRSTARLRSNKKNYMNKKSIISFCVLSILVFLSSSCVEKEGYSRSNLPKQVPANLEIIFLNSANEPSRLFHRIKLSRNNVTVEQINSQDLPVEKKFYLDDAQLNAIYEEFIKSDFDFIENQQPKEISNDAAYREIYIRADNISKTVKLGKNSPLSENDSDRFNNIWTDISDIVIDNVSRPD